MPDFDEIQKNLVMDAERAHQGGVRGRSLGGQVSECLLRAVLRANIKHLRFDQGAIVLHPDRLNDLEGNRSGITSAQIDIIVYKGEPFWPRPMMPALDVVSVLEGQVVCTIEVKKWVSLSYDVPRVNKNSDILRNLLPNRPTFFVGIRHNGDFNEIKKRSSSDATYLFSGRSKGLYPWNVPTESWLHVGELKGLINAITVAAT